jgi:alcohol dehydrogenase class IV
MRAIEAVGRALVLCGFGRKEMEKRQQREADYENIARFKKACALAAVLRAAGVASEEVPRMTAEQWELASSAAKHKDPTKPHSDKTRAMVAQILQPVDTDLWGRMSDE